LVGFKKKNRVGKKSRGGVEKKGGRDARGGETESAAGGTPRYVQKGGSY